MRNFIKKYVSALTDEHGQTSELRVQSVNAASEFGAGLRLTIGDQSAVLPQNLVRTLCGDLADWTDEPSEGSLRTYEYTSLSGCSVDAEDLKTFCIRRGDDGWGFCLKIDDFEVVLTEAQAADLASVISLHLAGGDECNSSSRAVVARPQG